MAEKVRLDTPRDLRRQLVKRPSYDPDSVGKFAEGFARFMGTAKFLTYMSFFIVLWIVWNSVGPADLRFDPFPFIFLTLMLSLQASYAAPLILLAQNRQEARDRVIAEQDREANNRAHADMEFLAREMASLRMALGEVATRDYLSRELRSIADDLTQRTQAALAAGPTPSGEATPGTAPHEESGGADAHDHGSDDARG